MSNATLQDTVNRYLDKLRASGKTNMFGAGPYVEKRFAVSRHVAGELVIEWMRTFGDRKRRGEVEEVSK